MKFELFKPSTPSARAVANLAATITVAGLFAYGVKKGHDRVYHPQPQNSDTVIPRAGLHHKG